MKSLRIVFQFGLLIGLGIAIPGLPTTAQSTSPNQAQPPAPGLQKLTGDDARRAEELDKAIEAALKADRWDEAIGKSEELLALRTLLGAEASEPELDHLAASGSWAGSASSTWRRTG